MDSHREIAPIVGKLQRWSRATFLQLYVQNGYMRLIIQCFSLMPCWLRTLSHNIPSRVFCQAVIVRKDFVLTAWANWSAKVILQPWRALSVLQFRLYGLGRADPSAFGQLQKERLKKHNTLTGKSLKSLVYFLWLGHAARSHDSCTGSSLSLCSLSRAILWSMNEIGLDGTSRYTLTFVSLWTLIIYSESGMSYVVMLKVHISIFSRELSESQCVLDLMVFGREFLRPSLV